MTAEETHIAAPQEPTNAPGRAEMPVEGRAGADAVSGSNEFISWGARSDVGLVRGHNEDSFLLRTPLFVVSDGMGGHAAGEVASSIAVETIGERAPGTADDVLLGAAVEAANANVIKAAEEGVGKPGMGCTATAVLIEKNHMAVAHVGDSRLYVLHAGSLVRVTHDHSFVEEMVRLGGLKEEEARHHPDKNIITRAIGVKEDVEADIYEYRLKKGDVILMCTDGLSNMVEDEDMFDIVKGSRDVVEAVEMLIEKANSNGGRDNIGVVLAEPLSDEVSVW